RAGGHRRSRRPRARSPGSRPRGRHGLARGAGKAAAAHRGERALQGPGARIPDPRARKGDLPAQRKENDMIRKTLLIASLAVFGGLALPLPCRAAALPDPSGFEASGDSQEDKLYEEGQKALDDGNWDRAAESFMEVVKANGARADAALYWVAYSLNKQGRKADALAILGGDAAQQPPTPRRGGTAPAGGRSRPAAGR